MLGRWAFLFFLIAEGCSGGYLKLPHVFSDHMVLQRGKQVPVWGWANPNTEIKVQFAGQVKKTTAGTDGAWRVNLDPMEASEESRDFSVSAGGVKIQFSDVLVGEVWLGSGQSNMEWPMTKVEYSSQEIAASNFPQIRLFNIPRRISPIPLSDVETLWQVCAPVTIANFSGVSFFMGRQLHRDLKMPIGLISSAWGGAPIESWIPPLGFKTLEMPQRTAFLAPMVLHQGMIHAVVPYAIRGVIWYQGESNHRDGMLYVKKVQALVKAWRRLWGDEFFFNFVQIAPFNYEDEDPSLLPLFWEAQSEILKVVPRTGMVVISDISTPNDIHPPNKQEVGRRLALLAEATAYDMKVVAKGPVFASMEKHNGALRVNFSSADGLTTRDGNAPNWFEVAGKDGLFKKAEARIDGNSVVLANSEISQPVAVRFAWHKLAIPNLINSAGLPAGSFRAH